MRANSPTEHPPQPRTQREHLHRSDRVEPAGERLLAGLVAEQRAAGIGARRSPEQRQQEQRRFLDTPAPGLGLELVDAEGGEGEEVEGD